MAGGISTQGASGAPAGFGFGHLPQRPLPPLDPGTWALTGAAVEAWAARARPGAQLVYARGNRLVQSDGVAAVQDLCDRRIVTLAQRRIAEGDIAYIAERLAGEARPPAAGPPRAAPEDMDEVAMLMAVLRRLAAKKLACPTNRELGAEIGELLDSAPRSPDRVAYLLRKQISARRIAIDALGSGCRIVTILATGQKTGGAS